MDILLLSRYGRLGSSSRVRFYQFLPYLEARGFRFTVAPLLDDAYVENLYTGRPQSRPAIARGYFRRLGRLLGARRYDLIWLEKELFPWMPAWFEAALPRLGAPYAVDYDDAVFHRYELHSSGAARRLLGGKISAVMKRAAAVVAGNAYLADYARSAGAGCVEIIPSVVDLERYALSNLSNPEPVVGWIGAPVTAPYLEAVGPALKEVAAAHEGLRTVLVGSGPLKLEGAYAEVRPWTEAGETGEIARFSVGIMPLPDEPFERGKCGYKLIQYMAAGVPVVASPVGVNTEIVEHGANGFLAGTHEEWVRALDALLRDPPLRAKMGVAGRKKVEESYSLRVAAPRLAEVLRAAARQSS